MLRRQEGSIVIIGVLDSESLGACGRVKNKLTVCPHPLFMLTQHLCRGLHRDRSAF